MLKPKKAFEAMEKEKDQGRGMNIQLATKNANLKADIKKLEDREVSWGRKLI